MNKLWKRKDSVIYQNQIQLEVYGKTRKYKISSLSVPCPILFILLSSLCRFPHSWITLVVADIYCQFYAEHFIRKKSTEKNVGIPHLHFSSWFCADLLHSLPLKHWLPSDRFEGFLSTITVCVCSGFLYHKILNHHYVIICIKSSGYSTRFSLHLKLLTGFLASSPLTWMSSFFTG